MIFRDLLPLPTGELAVRPAFAAIFDAGYASSVVMHWFFSFRVSTSDETRYCITTDNGTTKTLLLVDGESGVTIQSITLPFGARVDLASAALVHGQLIVAVPGGGVYWGWDNNTLEAIAKPTAGIMTGLDTLDPPDGGVAECSGRAAYHDGTTVYISDPLLPRAVVGNNLVTPPMGGRIMRLMSGERGDLWIVTSNEVYRIPADNLAQGQGLQGSLARTREYVARHPLSVAYAGDRPWGLTETGVIPLDGSGEEIRVLPEVAWGRYGWYLPTTLDGARLYGGGDTLLVACGSGTTIMLNVRTGFRSVWNFGAEYNVSDELVRGYDPVGIGATFDRRMAIGTSGRVVRLDGDYDWHSPAVLVSGGVITRDVGGPEASTVVRQIHVRSDAPGGVTIGDDISNEESITSSESRAPIPGTATWASSTVANSRMERYEGRQAIRGDERCVEVSAGGGSSRIDPGSMVATHVSPQRTHK